MTIYDAHPAAYIRPCSEPGQQTSDAFFYSTNFQVLAKSCRTTELSRVSGDVKRVRNLEAEAIATRPRPRSRPKILWKKYQIMI